MMNEIPTKTRTGERTEPFLMAGQKKSRVDSVSGNLLRRSREVSILCSPRVTHLPGTF